MVPAVPVYFKTHDTVHRSSSADCWGTNQMLQYVSAAVGRDDLDLPCLTTKVCYSVKHASKFRFQMVPADV